MGGGCERAGETDLHQPGMQPCRRSWSLSQAPLVSTNDTLNGIFCLLYSKKAAVVFMMSAEWGALGNCAVQLGLRQEVYRWLSTPMERCAALG